MFSAVSEPAGQTANKITYGVPASMKRDQTCVYGIRLGENTQQREQTSVTHTLHALYAMPNVSTDRKHFICDWLVLVSRQTRWWHTWRPRRTIKCFAATLNRRGAAPRPKLPTRIFCPACAHFNGAALRASEIIHMLHGSPHYRATRRDGKTRKTFGWKWRQPAANFSSANLSLLNTKRTANRRHVRLEWMDYFVLWSKWSGALICSKQ